MKETPFPVLYFHTRELIAGGEQSLLHLVSHLNRSLFFPYFVVSQEGEFSEALRKEKVQVFFVPFPPPKSLRFDRIWNAIRQLEGVVIKTKAYLLHGNTPRDNLYAGIVGYRRKIPVVWHARNLIYGKMIDTDRIFSFLPTQIICNSEAIQKRFKKSQDDFGKAITIYSGVDVKEFHPDEERGRQLREELGCGEAPLIGIAARIGLGKGHETFIEAANLVHPHFPEARFLIVGRAENEEDHQRELKLRGLVKRFGLSGIVLFLGYRKDMPDIMTALSFLVVATEAEPFGRVVLEALASGRPVVGTESGGTPEVVKEGENGFLVPPKNAQAMASAMMRLLGSPTEAKQMGERGRQKILSGFTIETHTRKIEHLYLSLIT